MTWPKAAIEKTNNARNRTRIFILRILRLNWRSVFAASLCEKTLSHIGHRSQRLEVLPVLANRKRLRHAETTNPTGCPASIPLVTVIYMLAGMRLLLVE